MGEICIEIESRPDLNEFEVRRLSKQYKIPYATHILEALENIDAVTAITIRDDIEYMIKMHEPRVELLDVQSLPNYDNNQFDVVIVYKIRGSSNPPQELEFVLLPSR